MLNQKVGSVQLHWPPAITDGPKKTKRLALPFGTGKETLSLNRFNKEEEMQSKAAVYLVAGRDLLNRR